MPKALSKFRTGVQVEITCYNEGCENSPVHDEYEDVLTVVTLGGIEYDIHPSFIRTGGVGRFRWNPNTTAKGFELSIVLSGSGYCRCSRCGTLFGSVIVISNGRGRKPLIFGYDPEPA